MGAWAGAAAVEVVPLVPLQTEPLLIAEPLEGADVGWGGGWVGAAGGVGGAGGGGGLAPLQAPPTGTASTYWLPPRGNATAAAAAAGGNGGSGVDRVDTIIASSAAAMDAGEWPVTASLPPQRWSGVDAAVIAGTRERVDVSSTDGANSGRSAPGGPARAMSTPSLIVPLASAAGPPGGGDWWSSSASRQASAPEGRAWVPPVLIGGAPTPRRDDTNGRTPAGASVDMAEAAAAAAAAAATGAAVASPQIGVWSPQGMAAPPPSAVTPRWPPSGSSSRGGDAHSSSTGGWASAPPGMGCAAAAAAPPGWGAQAAPGRLRDWSATPTSASGSAEAGWPTVEAVLPDVAASAPPAVHFDFGGGGGVGGAPSGGSGTTQPPVGAADPNPLLSTAAALPRRPRRRARPARSAGITWAALAGTFHLPRGPAAAALGVCVTVLKRRCRALGLAKWPYRSLAAVEAAIGRVRARAAVAAAAAGRPVGVGVGAGWTGGNGGGASPMCTPEEIPMDVAVALAASRWDSPGGAGGASGGGGAAATLGGGTGSSGGGAPPAGIDPLRWKLATLLATRARILAPPPGMRSVDNGWAPAGRQEDEADGDGEGDGDSLGLGAVEGWAGGGGGSAPGPATNDGRGMQLYRPMVGSVGDGDFFGSAGSGGFYRLGSTRGGRDGLGVGGVYAGGGGVAGLGGSAPTLTGPYGLVDGADTGGGCGAGGDASMGGGHAMAGTSAGGAGGGGGTLTGGMDGGGGTGGGAGYSTGGGRGMSGASSRALGFGSDAVVGGGTGMSGNQANSGFVTGGGPFQAGVGAMDCSYGPARGADGLVTDHGRAWALPRADGGHLGGLFVPGGDHGQAGDGADRGGGGYRPTGYWGLVGGGTTGLGGGGETTAGGSARGGWTVAASTTDAAEGGLGADRDSLRHIHGHPWPRRGVDGGGSGGGGSGVGGGGDAPNSH